MDLYACVSDSPRARNRVGEREGARAVSLGSRQEKKIKTIIEIMKN